MNHITAARTTDPASGTTTGSPIPTSMATADNAGAMSRPITANITFSPQNRA